MPESPTNPRLLASYMKTNGLTPDDVAHRLTPPVTRSAVVRWKNGSRTPAELYRPQIEELTGGYVPADGWQTVAERARAAWLAAHPVGD